MKRMERIIAFADELIRTNRTNLITHEELKRALGYSTGDTGYYEAVDALRRYLRDEYSVFLKTERSAGYSVLKHGREDEYVEQRLIDGSYRIKKAAAAVRCIRFEGLEPGDVVRIVKTKNKLAAIELFTKQS